MTEREIFLAVLDLSDPADRTHYLEKVCRDPEQRARVESLLLSHDTAGSFLGNPAVQPQEPNGATQELGVDRIANCDAADDLQFLTPSTRPDSLGRLAHYEMLQVLGRGGFGIVFRAFDDILQRVVAIKVMAPQIASLSPARKRFLREARSSAAVRHENVVQVYEVGEQPLPYLAMEFIPGETLQQRLDRIGPVEVSEVLRIGRQIAEGLAAAHASDLIHRDIKPGNILLEGGSQKVKITDFGLARAADDASISQSGVVAGTPMFMSPEQALGHTIDQRADLFSLGSVLYQMASGRPPFRAPSVLAVLKRVAEEPPRPIPEIIPETPNWLCGIITKLHAKNPDDRFQSAREVADLLADCEAKLKAKQEVKNILPAAAKRAGRKWVAAAAVLLLPVIALAVTEFGGVTHLFRQQATSDPDRKAAEYVLSIGGQVQVDGRDRKISAAADLPRDPFRLTWVGLLHSNQVTDAGLANFKDCKDLTFLGLFDTSVSDEGLANFHNCAKLTFLNLSRTKISDAGLANFKNCTELTIVVLNETKVSDSGLAYLKNSKNLTKLFLQTTKVTAAGIDELKKALPDCKIEWDGVFAKADAQPFVVTEVKGQPDRSFATLKDAVEKAANGDTIEIRGNGPFETPPIDLGKKALIIRAGPGSWPVVRLDPKHLKAPAAMLTNHFPLTLEGVELQRLNSAEDGVGPDIGNVVLAKGPIRIANVRLVHTGSTNAVAFGFSQHNNSSEIVNTQIVSPWSGISLWPDPKSEFALSVRNCVLAGGGGIAINIVSASSPKTVFQLRHNTVAVNHAFGFGFWGPGDWLKDDKRPPPITLDASGNVFAFRGAKNLIWREETGVKDGAMAKVGLKKLVSWNEDINLFADKPFLFDTKPAGEVILIEKHEDWRKFWNLASPRALVGEPTFQAVTLDELLNDEKIRTETLPAAFKLAKNSLGKGKGENGKDLGADVDLVGPGLAYERWQKTPEYQEWRKRTAELMTNTVDDAWIKQVVAMPAERQVEAVAAKLKDLNPGFDGKVGHKIEDGVVTELRIVTDNVTNISPIQVFNGLRVLDCSGTPDPADWQKRNGQLTDLTPLKGMNLAGLTELYLNDTKVTDAGLAHFKDCKNLTFLQLVGTKVSNAGLSHFKDCKDLTRIHLNATQVSDAGLAHFKDCKNLTILTLGGTKLSNAGLAYFKDCTKLEHLYLNYTQVSDAGLVHFKDCKNLTHLLLNDTKLTDAGLDYFKDCKDLTFLDLRKTKVTAAKVEEFKKALPGCKIEWNGDDPAQKQIAPPPAGAPLEAGFKADHQKLQGTWDRPPAKDDKGLLIQGVRLTFKENRLKVILYVKETDLTNFEEGTFDLKEMGKTRVIHQPGDGELDPSSTPYRFDGDTLILDAPTGALKGTWRRLKESK